ncbi:MAG: photosynthetic complex assembly protein PuhC [Roseovarius sp.]
MTQIEAQAHTPHQPHDKELIPRMLTRAMLALVLTILALVTIARLTGQPLVAQPPAGQVIVERQFVLSGDLSGAAQVHTPQGVLIADLSPEEGGFISGVHRVIIRERTKHRVAIEGPITLTRRDTGRIDIYDPATGWSADLMGFGADNARAFAKLLAN